MKRLALERKKRNMSQTDLAFKLRIHPSQISKIESGVARPYKPSRKKLEEFFNKSIDDLLEEVN
ncbi:helix-turn-helix domain-containing protein [Natronospora cellulosivora (SeqCode)]